MTDIFGQEDEDFLAQLTGPGGKFDKSRYTDESELMKAMAKSISHADKFIAAKNEQFDQLREDYLRERDENRAKANLEDYAKRISSNDQQTPPAVNEQKPLDEVKFKALAAEQALAAYEQLEAKKKLEANFAVFENKLREKYGDKSREVLRERMNALNLTQDDIRLLASKSPEAVINTLGLNQPAPQSYSLPRSSTNSDSFRPDTTTRDALYYEQLRREKPKEYFSEKVSVQRIKDMDHPDFMKRYTEREMQRAGGY